jgi:hypothetical protein
LNQDTEFSQVDVLGYQWTFMFNIVAINLIIRFVADGLVCINSTKNLSPRSTFTVFKYLNVNPRMSMMWKTLEKASPDLAAFLVFFGIIFITFVASGYLMFGSQLESFRTFTKATFACFNMLLGDFQYDMMEREGNKFYAPLYFTLFMLLVTFILVNVFLAIVQDAYVIVQLKYQNRPTLAVALRRWVNQQTGKVRFLFYDENNCLYHTNTTQVRSCIGKTALSQEYEAAGAQISDKQLRRMFSKLNIERGRELSREELIRALVQTLSLFFFANRKTNTRTHKISHRNTHTYILAECARFTYRVSVQSAGRSRCAAGDVGARGGARRSERVWRRRRRRRR